ncbi:MAG: hypothetical protein H7Z76_11875 [Methylotenera sp.]|nr:hypothetical protein [Flavobacterium sp.]
MKPTIYILTLAFGLGSCQNQTTEKAADKISVDTLQNISANKQKQDIFIKDKSQYDQTFIDGLADCNEPIKLVDNYIVIGKDTTYFPNDLSLNQPTIFTAIKNNDKYVLTVTRTNLTTLTYNFQITDKDNQTVETKSGKAILGSTFFLGPEGDDDIETKSGYGSQEYRDHDKDRWLSIRIEIGKVNNGKQRAKIQHGSNDTTKKTLNLDECPTLRTE